MRCPLITLIIVTLIGCWQPRETRLVSRTPIQNAEQPALAPVPVVGDVTPPILVHRVEPVIPEREKMRVREQPRMFFELTIDSAGNVAFVRTLQANDESLLPNVIAAIKQWKYRPATLHGKPVAV